MLESLAHDPAERRRALEVQAETEARLVACGGVTGQGIESHWLAFHSTRATEKPPQKPKRGNTGYRFSKRCAVRNHPVVEAPFWFTDRAEDFTKAYQSADEWSLEGYRHKFHQLLYGEVETTDRMGKMLAEFPELPWEMRMELANQMWDEARHIEIVAKACEEDLGAQLGYGPWPLAWWWMQNETDPLRRISVTNSWAEANLMHTLREWRVNAEQRGYTRLAELCDYLQADELNHVKLATRWIRRLTEADPQKRDELVTWSKAAVNVVQGFYDTAYGKATPVEPAEPHFSFLRGDEEPARVPKNVVGE
jgi:hypothetical protein